MKIFLLYGLSTLLIAASFPTGPFPELAWIAFTPLALAIESSKLRNRPLLTLLYSVSFWYISSWWFVTGLENIADLTGSKAWLISIIPALIGGTPYLLYIEISRRSDRFNPCYRPATSAALLTLLVTTLPNPFPGHPAHALYRSTTAIQLCAILGVTGLLFAICLCSFILASALKSRSNIGRIILFVATVSVPAAVYLHGSFAFQRYEALEQSYPLKYIGVVQPNIPLNGGEKLTADSSGYLKGPIELTKELSKTEPTPDIITWPEMPSAFSVTHQPNDYKWMQELTKEIGVPLVISDYFYESVAGSDAPLFFNTLRILNGSPESSQVYRKNILIPFGEYIPLEKTFPWLGDLFPDVRRYTSGATAEILNSGDFKIAPAICLEAIYSSFIAGLASQGANIIVNPADDAYFGDTPGAEVHLALASLRAVEYRIPLIRVTNSGITQVISASGRALIEASPMFKESAFKVAVRLPPAASGTNPNYYALILCGLLILWGLMRARQL